MKKHVIFTLLQILSAVLLSSTLIFSQTGDKSKNIRLRVSVMSKNGQVITGLKKENFAVREGKTEQEISSFSAEEEPANVAVLLDVSSSISPRSRAAAAQSVLRFTQTTTDRNDYSLISFGEQIKLLSDWGSADEENLRALKTITGEKTKYQETSLWDACLYALNKLDEGKYQKKILLIFSDSLDNASKMDFGKIRKRLQSSNIIIYSIGLIDGKEQNSLSGMQGQAFLDELSSFVGGKSFYPLNQTELDNITEIISLLVKHQYVIGYSPKENTKKDKWQTVSVKAEGQSDKGKKVSFNVIVREGYLVGNPPE